jgi:hypothetical protein
MRGKIGVIAIAIKKAIQTEGYKYILNYQFNSFDP